MAIAASENYQLKWHSYGAHLHSSVATLLHSESFADVLLATSCGRHVAAHRFVLAACSSYLSHIFQTCHFGANTNAPIIVVRILVHLADRLFPALNRSFSRRDVSSLTMTMNYIPGITNRNRLSHIENPDSIHV